MHFKADLRLSYISKSVYYHHGSVHQAFTSFKATVAFSASILTLQKKKILLLIILLCLQNNNKTIRGLYPIQLSIK